MCICGDPILMHAIPSHQANDVQTSHCLNPTCNCSEYQET